MPNNHYDVVILGAGAAGYTSAIYAARAGLNLLLVAGPMKGGQLLYTHHIQNFPAFTGISGLDLVDKLEEQVRSLNVPIENETATNVDFNQRPFTITLSNQNQVWADSLIVATGSNPRWLGIPTEDKFKGQGISVCATCDGYFYKNKTVVVIGGGNTALYEALFLTSFAEHIYIINRDDKFTGERKLTQDVLSNNKISVYFNSEVVRFDGDKKLSSVVIKNNKLEEEKTLNVDGAFVAIGYAPNSQLFNGKLALTEGGYIQTNEKKETSVSGVFAAGDVQEPIFKQAIIACGSGAMAAMSAERYLSGKK